MSEDDEDFDEYIFDEDDEDEEMVEVLLVEDEDAFINALQEHVNKVIAKETIPADELDTYVTKEQFRSMVKEFYLGVDEDSGCPFMTEETYEELLLHVSKAFLGACLSRLASKGLIESAWDSDANEAIFWRPKK